MSAASIKLDLFQNGLPKGISNIARDGSSRLVSWVENGYAMTIARDTNGHPVKLVAKGQSQTLTQIFAFDPSTGLTVSTGGDAVPTSLIAELFGAGAGGGGGGSGVTIGTSTPLVASGAGTAGISTTNAAAVDHAHPINTPQQLNVFSVPAPWDPAGNVPTLVSSTAPAGGLTLFRCTGTGTTVLDGYGASPPWKSGDLVEWQPLVGTFLANPVFGPPVHISNYTPTTNFTGVTTESAAQMTMALGVVAAGQRVNIQTRLALSNTADTCTVRHYLNGTLISTIVVPNNEISIFIETKLVPTGSAAQSIMSIASNAGTLLSSQSNTTVDTSAAATITVTVQNSTTTKTASVSFLDSMVFSA